MDIFNIEPRPFIHSRENVMVSWSPKSACSHVAVWFFLQENLLRASNAYHPWVHKFRSEVYYKGHEYQRRKQEFLEGGAQDWTLIKVTRDPLKRMISSFRHAVKQPFLDKLILEGTGASVAEDGLSLWDFGEALAGKDLRYGQGVDMHVCGQHHPVWDLEFGTVIEINMDVVDLNSTLNTVADLTGLEQINFANVPKFKHLKASHYAEDNSQEFDFDLIHHHRFQRGGVKQFPKRLLTDNAYAQGLAWSLYEDDYARITGTTERSIA